MTTRCCTARPRRRCAGGNASATSTATWRAPRAPSTSGRPSPETARTWWVLGSRGPAARAGAHRVIGAGPRPPPGCGSAPSGSLWPSSVCVCGEATGSTRSPGAREGRQGDLAAGPAGCRGRGVRVSGGGGPRSPPTKHSCRDPAPGGPSHPDPAPHPEQPHCWGRGPGPAEPQASPRHAGRLPRSESSSTRCGPCSWRPWTS